jgi:hypothetical protein
MLRLLPFVALLLALAAHAADPPKKDPPPGPTVIRLAPQAKAPRRALAYHLMPDPLEAVAGDAAQLWLRAGINVRAVRHKWTEEEWKWAGPAGTPLNKLPVREIRTLMVKYLHGLELADRAALRARCHWDYEPLTVQNLHTNLPQEEVQTMREIIQLVSLRCRVEMAEKKFDDARRSAQTGLGLARHLGDSDIMIQDLVGIAMAAIAVGRLEEWVQIPDSPNLYWPLTELPRPLVGLRRSIRNELYTLDRSLPELRGLRSKKLSEGQARQTYDKMLRAWSEGIGEGPPFWTKGVAKVTITTMQYPVARMALVAAGRSEKELDAMPKLQVIALAHLEEHDRVRDDIIKWLAVPAFQGLPEIEKIVARETAKDKGTANVFLAMLLPMMSKVAQAQTRLDRNIAGLRAAEALRQHVADHGKPPATWADLKGCPAPTDPYTGKGFDAFYKVVDGKGVLEVPPMKGMPASLGKRYEVAPRVR